MAQWRARLGRLRRYDRIFLSPNAGDVALSSPASILAGNQAEMRTLVVSVFTETGVRDLPAAALEDTQLRSQMALMAQAEGHYQRRREDEIEAARRGGYAPLLVGMVGARLRRLDGRFYDLMGQVWGEMHSERETLDELVSLMDALIDACAPKEMVVPLGVGRHIDHRLVYTAAQKVSARRSEVQFWCYEERPYALVPYAAELRLRELGFNATVDIEALLTALWDTPYARGLGADASSRNRSATRYRALLDTPAPLRPLPPFRLLPWESPDALWRLISAYEDRQEPLHDRRHLSRVGRHEARRLGVGELYAERHWRLVP